jgi:hypothetical protein
MTFYFAVTNTEYCTDSDYFNGYWLFLPTANCALPTDLSLPSQTLPPQPPVSVPSIQAAQHQACDNKK